MSKVSIGVVCGAVSYVALVFGMASLAWGDEIHRKAFAVAIVALAAAVACIDREKKVPE